jgi:hypothetical protein
MGNTGNLRTTTIIHHKLHKTSPESWTATSTTTYFQLFWQCRVWCSHQHTPHLMSGMPYLSWPCNLLPLLRKAPTLFSLPASCEPKTMQCNPFMSTPFPKPKLRGCPKNIWKLKDLIFLYLMAPVKLQHFLSFEVYCLNTGSPTPSLCFDCKLWSTVPNYKLQVNKTNFILILSSWTTNFRLAFHILDHMFPSQCEQWSKSINISICRI